MAIVPYWICRFTTSNVYTQWTYVVAESTINVGDGFTMKETSGVDATVAQVIEGVQNNSGK